jgi:hypothetical protein
MKSIHRHGGMAMRLAVFLLALLLLCASWAYALDKAGLVMYLPFDEGNGSVARDVSGNGNDGELLGGSEWVDGHFGKGIHLQVAGDLVEVPHSDSLDINKEITLEIWAKVDAFVGDQHCAFISKGTTDQTGSYILHISNDNGFYLALIIFIGAQGPWPPPAVGTTTMGEWHHFAGSYDGAELRIYIDGELKSNANRSVGGDIDSSSDPVAIGRDNRADWRGRATDCIVDEARIWNRVLSESEIKEAMDGALLPVTPRDLLATMWGNVKTGF